MTDTATIASARAHLARAEADYRTEDGLAHLQEGLALLEEVTVDGAPGERAIAANLGARYAQRICESIRATVDADRTLAEPEIEQLFKVLLAFDAADLDVPAFARPLKIEIVRRLVEYYYEGHSEQEKRAALAQLAGIADGS